MNPDDSKAWIERLEQLGDMIDPVAYRQHLLSPQEGQLLRLFYLRSNPTGERSMPQTD